MRVDCALSGSAAQRLSGSAAQRLSGSAAQHDVERLVYCACGLQCRIEADGGVAGIEDAIYVSARGAQAAGQLRSADALATHAALDQPDDPSLESKRAIAPI
jgi:hypothetical protein